MKCRQAKKLASAYLDGQLASAHERAFLFHLAQCEICQAHAKRLRVMSEQLSRLVPVLPPRDLLPNALSAFDDFHQQRGTGPVVRFTNWAMMHSRVVSAVASFLITILCYGGILDQLKTIPYLPAFSRPESIMFSSSQFDWVNGRAASGGDNELYTFPRVKAGGQVDSSLANLGTSPIFVLALVQSDGRAFLVEVLYPRDDAELVEQVQTKLEQMRFSPAMAGGRPVATQLVLMLDQVDIRG